MKRTLVTAMLAITGLTKNPEVEAKYVFNEGV